MGELTVMSYYYPRVQNPMLIDTLIPLQIIFSNSDMNKYYLGSMFSQYVLYDLVESLARGLLFEDDYSCAVFSLPKGPDGLKEFPISKLRRMKVHQIPHSFLYVRFRAPEPVGILEILDESLEEFPQTPVRDRPRQKTREKGARQAARKKPIRKEQSRIRRRIRGPGGRRRGNAPATVQKRTNHHSQPHS